MSDRSGDSSPTCSSRPSALPRPCSSTRATWSGPGPQLEAQAVALAADLRDDCGVGAGRAGRGDAAQRRRRRRRALRRLARRRGLRADQPAPLRPRGRARPRRHPARGVRHDGRARDPRRLSARRRGRRDGGAWTRPSPVERIAGARRPRARHRRRLVHVGHDRPAEAGAHAPLRHRHADGRRDRQAPCPFGHGAGSGRSAGVRSRSRRGARRCRTSCRCRCRCGRASIRCCSRSGSARRSS